MICGITIFVKRIAEKQRLFLENKFSFGGWFDLKEGHEVPVPSRGFTNENYEKMLWRKVIYGYLEIRLGWKVDQLTQKEFYNLSVTGSIHKHAGAGDNSGMFTAAEAIKAINLLSDELQIDKERASISNIEIGVNLHGLSFPVRDWIKLDLLKYKSYPFEMMKTQGNERPIGKEAILTHRTIKLYWKGGNILRYEIHYKDMQSLRERYGLCLLSDLSETLLLKIAATELPATFTDISSLDGIRIVKDHLPPGLKKSDELVLVRFSNPLYLAQLDHSIKINIGANQYHALIKHRKRGMEKLKYLVCKFSQNNAQFLICNKILQAVEEKICPNLDTGVYPKKWTGLKVDSKGELKNNISDTTEDYNIKINLMQMGTKDKVVAKQGRRLIYNKSSKMRTYLRVAKSWKRVMAE